MLVKGLPGRYGSNNKFAIFKYISVYDVYLTTQVLIGLWSDEFMPIIWLLILQINTIGRWNKTINSLY